jgi:putative SOS response-associated peptidase YedK
MCSSYGFGGGPHGLGLTFDLPPMHEPDSRLLLEAWAREQRGRARITGRRARNLNPIIHRGYGERTVELGWWWLHSGGEPAPYSAFNSRDDTLLRKWRSPFQRRAIVPAHWYIERGTPFALPGDELFGIAAIVTPVHRGDGPAFMSCSLVTRDAVGAAADTHPRMPLLLPRGMHDEWLDPWRPGDAALLGAAVAGSEELSLAVRAIGERGWADPEPPVGQAPVGAVGAVGAVNAADAAASVEASDAAGEYPRSAAPTLF